MILQDTINKLQSNYSHYFENLCITDVRVGIFLTAVKLSDGSVGISGTISSSSGVHCKKENRDFGDFTPNRIIGKKIAELLNSSKQNSQIISLKIAALNAISGKLLDQSSYNILRNTDPINLVDLNSRKTITLVGAFQSYIHKISATKNRLNILEYDKDSLDDKDKKYFIPASDYKKILPLSDIVIITGQTLINSTLDDLLKATKHEAQIIVTGPSSCLLPDVLFANNVKVIGAIKSTDPEMMLKIAGEGGTGYHMFKYCAEKICIINEN